MSEMKDTILLAGIGLIGGSIALAIKKEHPHKRIIGVDISEEQLTAALKLGIIDERPAHLRKVCSKRLLSLSPRLSPKR